MTDPETTRWLAVADVALMCGVKESTVRWWVRRGRIRRTTRGIDGASVLRYLDERGDRGQHTRTQS